MGKQIKKIKTISYILMFLSFFALTSTRTQAYYWGNTPYGTVICGVIVVLSGMISRMITALDKELNEKEE